MKKMVIYMISAIVSVLVVYVIIELRNEPVVMALLAAGAATAAGIGTRRK